MFEHFNTPEEIFSFKLGSAHKMETKLLEVLEELEAAAQRDEIKQALREHREETRQHAMNIEQCFALLGEDIDDSPCPVIEAMAKSPPPSQSTTRSPSTRRWSPTPTPGERPRSPGCCSRTLTRTSTPSRSRAPR